MMKRDLLRVGDIAAATGVSADTIRHYEKKGVISGVTRDGSGYRRYRHETIDRVRIVRRALSIGFTLDELARIFKKRASGKPPCREVRDLAARKLREVEENIAALEKLRSTLAGTIASWETRLHGKGEDAFANLLDSLID